MTFAVTAPGKLFLLGEYAVLGGAPAIVAAVDHGVTCEVSEGDRIEAMDTRFVGPALRAAEAPPRSYHFSIHRGFDLPFKVGLGSSAAATVAAVAAGLVARGAALDPLEELAVRVHREVQGSGSGLDVRASARGGVHLFTASDRPPPCEGVRSFDASPIAVPPISVIHTGEVARTGPRVERWLAQPVEQRLSFESAARELLERFRSEPVAATEGYLQLLTAAAEAAGVDYMTDNHATIAALARASGGAAKPSGAGGGDVAVALIPDPAERARFEAACEAAGFPILPVQVADGVTVEQQK